MKPRKPSKRKEQKMNTHEPASAGSELEEAAVRFHATVKRFVVESQAFARGVDALAAVPRPKVTASGS